MTRADLKVFPLAVADLQGLTRLDLSHNFIGAMPAEFLRKTTVTHIDLSYNDIGKTPPPPSTLPRDCTASKLRDGVTKLP